MFIIRIFFYFNQSPIIKFFIKNYLSSFKNIFRIIVILFLFIIFHSLLIHVLVGQKSLIMSDLVTTIIVILKFILKFGDEKIFKDFFDIDIVLNVVLAFLIVNFVYVFLFSYIKENFYQEMEEYKRFISNKENKIIGDYFDFVKSSFIPFYFWWKNLKKLRKENYFLGKDEEFKLDKIENSKGI